MTVYSNQKVAFAGEIQFDNIPVYDTSTGGSPMIDNAEFMFVYINGERKGIKLYDIPSGMVSDNLETIESEHIGNIGPHMGSRTGFKESNVTHIIAGNLNIVVSRREFFEQRGYWIGKRCGEDSFFY